MRLFSFSEERGQRKRRLNTQELSAEREGRTAKPTTNHFRHLKKIDIVFTPTCEIQPISSILGEKQ